MKELDSKNSKSETVPMLPTDENGYPQTHEQAQSVPVNEQTVEVPMTRSDFDMFKEWKASRGQHDNSGLRRRVNAGHQPAPSNTSASEMNDLSRYGQELKA